MICTQNHIRNNICLYSIKCITLIIIYLFQMKNYFLISKTNYILIESQPHAMCNLLCHTEGGLCARLTSGVQYYMSVWHDF